MYRQHAVAISHLRRNRRHVRGPHGHHGDRCWRRISRGRSRGRFGNGRRACGGTGIFSWGRARWQLGDRLGSARPLCLRHSLWRASNPGRSPGVNTGLDTRRRAGLLCNRNARQNKGADCQGNTSHRMLLGRPGPVDAYLRFYSFLMENGPRKKPCCRNCMFLETKSPLCLK